MDSTTALLLAAHLAATASMVGLIWFVQVVHYPLFTLVGDDGFADYEAHHTRRTSFVVGPPMAAEGVLALVIAGWFRTDVGTGLSFAGLALLAVVHTSTVALQVPAHRRLAAGPDTGVMHRLVCTNWVRTAGWSLRGAVAVAMIVAAA
jgi:hypothetical protein